MGDLGRPWQALRSCRAFGRLRKSKNDIFAFLSDTRSKLTFCVQVMHLAKILSAFEPAVSIEYDGQ